MATVSMRWHLRQATDQDEEELYRIHRAAMRKSVEAIWGWVEGEQRDRFGRGFDSTRISVVTIQDRTVGFLRLEDRGEEFFLATIELDPEIQGFGLGGEIITSVVAESAIRGIPVRLRVLHGNPALRLYERLGFRPIGRTNTHIEMIHA